MDKEKLMEQLQQVREDAKARYPDTPLDKIGEKLESDFKKAERKIRGVEANQQRRWDMLQKEEREDPMLIDLLDGRKPENLLRRLTPKSKEEIIATGTAEEVAYLLSISITSAMGGDFDFLQTKERREIDVRLSRDEKRLANAIFAQLYALVEYESSFKIAFLNYQKDSAFLARFITEWEDDKRIADLLTTFHNKGMNITTDEVTLDNNASLFFNKRTKSYEVDRGTSDEETLNRHIDMRGIYLLRSMRSVKSKIMAIEKYIEERKLPIGAIPYTIGVCMDDIKEEIFWGDLLLDKKYFKSYLNERVSNGEDITIEDVEMAVFPDYYELKPRQAEVDNNVLHLRYREEVTLRYNNVFEI